MNFELSEDQRVLQAAADNRVKDWVLAVSDAVDLNDVAFSAFTVILRKFAKRPFHRPRVRRDPTFDHDLRCRRNTDSAADALHDFECRTAESTRDL